MMKKQNRITILITVTLLCVLVIFSTIMVGCNKRDEGRVEAPDVTDDVPEPDDDDDEDKDKEVLYLFPYLLCSKNRSKFDIPHRLKIYAIIFLI